MHGRAAWFSVTTILALAFAVLQAQSGKQLPTFRSTVEAVVLDVSVLDKDRNPIRGLKASDFTVIEDGKAQTITTFNAVDFQDPVPEPGAAAWTQEVPSDVSTNGDADNKRIVAIVMDDASPMPAVDVLRARATARKVIEALGPSDLACLVFREPGLSASDPDAPGLLFTYLVAAWNPAGEGPLGEASDGTPRAAAVPTASVRCASRSACSSGALGPTSRRSLSPPRAAAPAPSAPQAGGASKSHGGRGARAAHETGATAPGDGGAPDTAPVRGDGQVATVIDVVSVKRAWPAVLAEFKKARPSRSHLFNGTEVELVDGALVVEFPSDQGMLMKMAADAETMALLRQCVAAVLDADLLITYRLGRAGRSTERAVPDAPAGEAPSGDEGISADESVAPVGPVPSEDEGVGVVPEPGTPSTPDAPVAPAAPDAPPTPGAPLEHDDLEAQVIAELGASPVGDVTPEA